MTVKDLTPEFTTTGTNETAAAVEAGQRIGRPVEIADGFVATLNPVTGETTIHDIYTQREEGKRKSESLLPTHKKGRVEHTDSTSFTAYVQRHATPGTEIWANRDSSKITAILNADTGEAPGHRDHIAALLLKKSRAWDAWLSIDGKLHTQEDFASFIESRQIDIIEPAGASILELVQTIKQTTSVEFESAKRLSDGQTVLVHRETSTASAGAKGEFAVPEQFVIGIKPYETAQPYRVVAHLRTRVKEGRLALGIVLERPDDILDAAFTEVHKTVADALPDHPVFIGSVSYRYSPSSDY